ncbi:MAG: hypothetical protein GYA46_14750 [candidate division Zixibacteria bacterium]|nr:hypothetical protein [candidate division Zixibacteria bacterium]
MPRSTSISSATSIAFLRRAFVTATILLPVLTIFSSSGNSNSIGLNIYGKSYHFLEPYQNRDYLNETNPGLGARASFGNKSSGTYFVEGGFFEDTFRHRATYIAAGYMFRLWQQFRVGFNAGLYKTLSINKGGTAAVVPLASYSVKFVTLNVAYLPKFRNINAYHTLAGYLTVNLINSEPKKKS